jgi:hypothetical protein
LAYDFLSQAIEQGKRQKTETNDSLLPPDKQAQGSVMASF